MGPINFGAIRMVLVLYFYFVINFAFISFHAILVIVMFVVN